jgi:bile acid:Na+ symporter, BASS family
VTTLSDRTKQLLRFTDHYFIWMIIISYVAAAAMPGLGSGIRNVSFASAPLPALMLAVLLFNAGMGVKTEELRRLLRNPCLLVGAVFCNIIIPLVFIVATSFLISSWHNLEEVQIILTGLALVASMPIAGASTAWSQNCNGNVALSVGLVLSTTALSPIRS